MTSRYDELSPRARWFLENFDEIDLADICANNEKAAERTAVTIARVQNLRDAWLDAPDPLARAMAADLASTLRGPAAPDAGPTVAEAAADDEAHWTTKYAGETP